MAGSTSLNSQSLKVLHVIIGLNDGGAEGALYRLCLHDPRHRHIVVSLMDEGKYGPQLLAAGIEVHCMRLPRGKLTLGTLKSLWRIIRQIKPDVVQTWMYHSDLVGGMVARFAGVTNVVWGIRNSTLVEEHSSRKTIWIAKMCAKLSYWVPRKIVVCSHNAIEVHAKMGYDQNRMVYVPNGFDLNKFVRNENSRVTKRAWLGLSDDFPLIGMVARYDSQKDHTNLVLALSLLKEQGIKFVCLLVGTGMDAQNAELKKLLQVHCMDGHVILFGQRNDVPDLMSTLDLHVLSSSFGEAFPNVLAEAMACGTPCVATDVGDARLILGNTGWVVPPQDPKSLAQGIQSAFFAMSDTKAWQARQKAVRQRIEDNFTIERMVELYDAVWREGFVKKNERKSKKTHNTGHNSR